MCLTPLFLILPQWWSINSRFGSPPNGRRNADAPSGVPHDGVDDSHPFVLSGLLSVVFLLKLMLRRSRRWSQNGGLRKMAYRDTSSPPHTLSGVDPSGEILPPPSSREAV